MSYPLNGVNFVDQPFLPSSDCAIWRKLISDGILTGFSIASAGASLTVQPGWIMVGGKELQLPTAITVPINEKTSGKARLVVNADLTKSSTEDTFDQGFINLEYEEDWDDLIQGNLAGSGTLYQMVLCVVTLGVAGITGIISTCGEAYARAGGVVLDLPAAGWVNGSQTVRVDGVHLNTLVTVTSNPLYDDEFEMARIRCTGQAEGSLTFSCAVTPEDLIKVNVHLS